MDELSEREEKIKKLFLEEFPDMLSDTFEAEDLARATEKVFRNHGKDFNKPELEADLVFMLNKKGKSIISIEEDRKFLDRIIELF